ncbi:MFS transporter [Solihabitans fulvus]|uniref:MFS transporter n=1 Tax=Solihabitans fulvus TaxID=1892852 RepID=UPI001CB75EB2|nr:MFS transporter [Solihabitans fulvus]
MTGTVSPVLRPPFRGFLAARFVSLLGTSMSSVALALGILDASGKAGDLGIVLAANIGPQLVLLLVGGAIADRFSRRTLLVVANLGSGVTQAGVALLLLTGTFNLFLVSCLALLNGALEAFASPALRGIVPDLVPPTGLQRANSALSLSRNVTRIAGPVLAGAIAAASNGAWAVAADALSFLIAAAFLARLPSATPVTGARGSLLPDIREGWREFRSTPWIWTMASSYFLINLVNVGPWQVLGPTLTKQHSGDAAWGIVLSVRAVGLLAMSLLMYRLVLRRPLRAGAVAAAVGATPLIALGTGASLPVLLVCTFVGAMGFTVAGITWDTTLQQNVPRDMLSRVSSYDDLLSFGSIPLGLLLIGPAANTWGAEPVALIGGVAFVVVALVPLLVRPVRELRAVTPEEVR